MRRLVFALLACACVRAPPPATGVQGGEISLAYRIAWLPRDEAIDVSVQRLSGEISHFQFTASDTSALDVDGLRVAVDDDGVFRLPAGWTVLRYRYVVSRANGASVLAHGREFLIRPTVSTDDIRATLEVAGGVAATLPWEPVAPNRWAVRGTDLVDSGYAGFGGRSCSFDVGGAQLDVRILEGKLPAPDEAICEWVRKAAASVLAVRSSYPYRRTAVFVVPIFSNSVSNYSEVRWSSPPSVMLQVGSNAHASELEEDWTSVHELLHLAHPFFHSDERWFTEGLATYYSYVARARTGRDSPLTAWNELVAGFERGEEQGRDLAMAEAASPGGFHYLAQYWTGALFALDLDVQIRRATKNAKSLDDALDAAPKVATLAEFGAIVDAVAGAKLFDAALARHRAGKAFAQRAAILGALGVAGEAGALTLKSGAPDAAIRDAITRKR